MMMDDKMHAPQIRFSGFSDDWEQRKLGEVVDFIGTGKSHYNLKEIGKYEILGSTGIIGYDDNYDYEGDFLLTARVGANAGTIYRYSGKVKITDNTVFLKATQLNFVYSLIKKFDLKSLSFGSGQPLIKSSELKQLKISIPINIEEQQKIGSFFQQFDSLIALHQCKLDKLINIKKSMLEKMFVEKNTDVPEIRFKGFTDTWEQRKLGDLASIGSGRDYKHLSSGNIPVYGTGGYMLSVNEYLSDKDAIGIGRKGTIDKPYILNAPFWTVDTLFFVVPKNQVDLQYLFSVFQKIYWKKYDESTGVPSLSKQSINNITIYSAFYEEQKRIGKFIGKLEDLITLHQRK